jgi:hypothetical protein
MTINATAVWRVRPSGANTNGGAYDAGIAGAATDYSQQNSAQASGTAGTATGTTAFADAVAAAFTSAMVGNCIQIVSGSGFTAGFYFVTAFTSSTAVTLDRSPGTGTVAVWHLGGGWADFWTNTTANIVPGNTVYVLGSGIPNPSSYTYDYTNPTFFTPVSGNATAGYITFAADPQTPNFSTGGVPCIKQGTTRGVMLFSTNFIKISNLWIVLAVADNGLFQSMGAFVMLNCVVDQFAFDASLMNTANPQAVLGNEMFSVLKRQRLARLPSPLERAKGARSPSTTFTTLSATASISPLLHSSRFTIISSQNSTAQATP